MVGFRSVKKYTDAWEEGRFFTSHFRKAPTSSGSSTCWVDMSMYGGGPPANYYAATPLTAATLDGTTGIYHGDDKSPAQKYLASWSMCANSNNNRGRLTLQDYLLFYPFVDCDDLTTQDMTNTVTLPRYTDGAGVQVMAVCQAASVGGGSFVFEYVNQDGVTKTSLAQLCQAGGNTALPSTLIAGPQNGSSAYNYLQLAGGDSGVRRINSVTFTVSNGGLMALVLVKPLASLSIREGSVETESSLLQFGMPTVRIYDGAYLSYIHLQEIAQNATLITGRLQFIWDEGA